ncbi:hypothetical protein EI94DRAFT_1811029 [Lactarius quietus]|nr:hypothetical protein EI94DRAFT_1811029 [Lactarius quietus]
MTWDVTLERESSKATSLAPSPGSRMDSSAFFSVKVPLPPRPNPQILMPPIKYYRQPSPSALSVSSNDRQNLRARVVELEATVEDLKRDVAALKKATGHK